jgi:hypothetical protein
MPDWHQNYRSRSRNPKITPLQGIGHDQRNDRSRSSGIPNWFELVVDIDQFEMLEQEMRLGLDAAEAMPTQGGIQHGPSPAQLSERKQASV